MANLNYAQQYSQALAQAYPNVLRFGRLWSNENATKYRVVDAKTIQIPSITVGGRTDGNRDTIGTFTRNFDNAWETKTLENHRQWQTLVHPKDVNETNQVVTIQNITKTMNEFEKFPEMDAYTISQLYKLKNEQETIVAETSDLTSENIMTKFEALMDEMDEALVPSIGRILYVDTYTKTLIDNAITIVRANGQSSIAKAVTRLEEVEVIAVPTKLMKTKYTFTTGFAPAGDAKDIAMMLVHPSAILPIASYEFSQLQAPSALTQGKYVYFEESFEDIFILNKRHDAIKFVVKHEA
ncbi:capsid protein [Romboutsia ilealis]|uniref:capsid protein n=1 Tax=Romboutsia ilealis TaxID=1115758 RepID=UPI0025B767D4|nr:capsid protein [Romboutsia ilealis]